MHKVFVNNRSKHANYSVAALNSTFSGKSYQVCTTQILNAIRNAAWQYVRSYPSVRLL